MDNQEAFFEMIPVSSEDYKGMDASEAYACGIELGCIFQAVSFSRHLNETLKIKIPSTRHALLKEMFERTGEDAKFYWVNDDVLTVVIER
jgi:hypothetical protein